MGPLGRFGNAPRALPDVFFLLVGDGYCPKGSWLLDLVPGVFLVLSLTKVLVNGHYEMLVRALNMVGCIFFLRAGSILLTILPDPFPQCLKRAPFESAFHEMWVILAEDPMVVTSLCGHCLFSGHACTLTVVALIWTSIGARFWAVLAWAVLSGEVFFMVACQFHYSCDILWGVVVGACVFFYVMQQGLPSIAGSSASINAGARSTSGSRPKSS